MPHRDIFKTILFCTDFSENSDLAFYHALNIAEANPGCELVIFHVIPEPNAQFWKSYIYELDDIDDKAKADIDQKIAESYLSRVPNGVGTSVTMTVGQVEQKILETAAARQVDLIVIGRQGSSRLRTPFLGNTTERIARKAPCPVLVVPDTPVSESHQGPG